MSADQFWFLINQITTYGGALLGLIYGLSLFRKKKRVDVDE